MEKHPLLRRVTAIVSWVFVSSVILSFFWGLSFGEAEPTRHVMAFISLVLLYSAPVVFALSLVDVFRKPRQPIVIVSLALIVLGVLTVLLLVKQLSYF